MLHFLHMTHTQTHLDDAFIAQQKEKLTTEKERLVQELQKRGKADSKDPTNYTASYQEYGDDEESNAAEYANHETDIAIVNELEQQLQKTVAALQRIEDGTYGLDIDTQEPIEQKRLEAVPAAEHCIKKDA